MAWNRTVQVLLGVDLTDPTQVIDVSGLDISGKVTRANRMVENKAELTIYNASESTRNRISTEGQACIVKLGYEDDGVGTVFIGQVDHASSYHAGPDWITKVVAVAVRSVDFNFGTTPFAVSVPPGGKLATVLESLALVLGIGIIGEQNADVVLPNGYTFAGASRDALTYCDKILRSNGRGLHVDLGELVVYKAGGAVSEFDSLYLTPDTGLLHAEPVEDNAKEARQLAKTEARLAQARKRRTDAKTTKQRTAATQTLQKETAKEAELKRKLVKLRALINHTARPNGLATVESQQVQGSYVIDSVEFVFDNMAKDFEMNLEASA